MTNTLALEQRIFAKLFTASPDASYKQGAFGEEVEAVTGLLEELMLSGERHFADPSQERMFKGQLRRVVEQRLLLDLKQDNSRPRKGDNKAPAYADLSEEESALATIMAPDFSATRHPNDPLSHKVITDDGLELSPDAHESLRNMFIALRAAAKGFWRDHRTWDEINVFTGEHTAGRFINKKGLDGASPATAFDAINRDAYGVLLGQVRDALWQHHDDMVPSAHRVLEDYQNKPSPKNTMAEEREMLCKYARRGRNAVPMMMERRNEAWQWQQASDAGMDAAKFHGMSRVERTERFGNAPLALLTDLIRISNWIGDQDGKPLNTYDKIEEAIGLNQQEAIRWYWNSLLEMGWDTQTDSPNGLTEQQEAMILDANETAFALFRTLNTDMREAILAILNERAQEDNPKADYSRYVLNVMEQQGLLVENNGAYAVHDVIKLENGHYLIDPDHERGPLGNNFDSAALEEKLAEMQERYKDVLPRHRLPDGTKGAYSELDVIAKQVECFRATASKIEIRQSSFKHEELFNGMMAHLGEPDMSAEEALLQAPALQEKFKEWATAIRANDFTGLPEFMRNNSALRDSFMTLQVAADNSDVVSNYIVSHAFEISGARTHNPGADDFYIPAFFMTAFSGGQTAVPIVPLEEDVTCFIEGQDEIEQDALSAQFWSEALSSSVYQEYLSRRERGVPQIYDGKGGVRDVTMGDVMKYYGVEIEGIDPDQPVNGVAHVFHAGSDLGRGNGIHASTMSKYAREDEVEAIIRAGYMPVEFIGIGGSVYRQQPRYAMKVTDQGVFMVMSNPEVLASRAEEAATINAQRSGRVVGARGNEITDPEAMVETLGADRAMTQRVLNGEAVGDVELLGWMAKDQRGLNNAGNIRLVPHLEKTDPIDSALRTDIRQRSYNATLMYSAQLDPKGEQNAFMDSYYEMGPYSMYKWFGYAARPTSRPEISDAGDMLQALVDNEARAAQVAVDGEPFPKVAYEFGALEVENLRAIGFNAMPFLMGVNGTLLESSTAWMGVKNEDGSLAQDDAFAKPEAWNKLLVSLRREPEEQDKLTRMSYALATANVEAAWTFFDAERVVTDNGVEIRYTDLEGNRAQMQLNELAALFETDSVDAAKAANIPSELCALAHYDEEYCITLVNVAELRANMMGKTLMQAIGRDREGFANLVRSDVNAARDLLVENLIPISMKNEIDRSHKRGAGKAVSGGIESARKGLANKFRELHKIARENERTGEKEPLVLSDELLERHLNNMLEVRLQSGVVTAYNDNNSPVTHVNALLDALHDDPDNLDLRAGITQALVYDDYSNIYLFLENAMSAMRNPFLDGQRAMAEDLQVA